MAVPITPGTGASSVAAELVGGFNYQQIEVYGGGGASVLTVNPDGSFKASIIGTPTVSFSGSPSISGAVTVVGTPSISGTVNIGTQSGSVVAFQGGAWTPSVSGAVQVAGGSPASIMTITRLDNQVIGSMMGMVGQVVIHGLTSAGGGSYVDVKVDPSGALVTTAGSVIAYQVPGSVMLANVSGSVVAFLGGTQVTSLVSTVPSSVLVGASIFGQLPAGTAPLGSVATLQGTNPWIVQTVGSIITTNIGSVITVIQGSVAAATTITSIATANGGLPIFAPLTSRVQGTADFRGNAGASIAVLSAGGAGVRNYVQYVQIMNFGSASVLVTLADNTTSILGYTIAPAGGGSNFDTFYRSAANSPVTASISGQASVLVSMQGFTSST